MSKDAVSSWIDSSVSLPHIFLTVLVSVLTPLLCTPPAAFAQNAPGGEGAPSVWAPAGKDFLATSASATSRVHFTGAEGIVTEVFWPGPDTVQYVDLQFLVTDAARSWFDEERRQQRTVSLVDDQALAWRVVTENPSRGWRIEKTIFSDPDRQALIQRATFKVTTPGRTVGDYNLYVLGNPAINNSGGGQGGGTQDNSRTLTQGGRTMLIASEPGSTSAALAVSLPWKTVAGEPAVSNGIVGASDGFTDLKGDRTMDWRYPGASSGNVAQMGWIDLGTSPSGSADFSVALGFGGNEAAAMTEAAGALDHADTAQATYIAQWKAYTAGLADLGGTADNQFRLAAMVIKSAQDKTNGAMVAGLGTPWGETNTDTNVGGYHLVWPRDLFKFASAMINAGDSATANRAVEYLFNIQMDQTTGRFPQNTFDSGKPYWNGLQMDETAMPIVLAWRLGRNDLWPKVKLAADFVLRTGPRTDQERWEEVSGYSPSTIAAEVAGLVAAAELAQANGDTDRAKHYRAKADEWRNNVANWTFTQAGPLGNKRYYIRISNSLYADRDDKIHLENGAPEIDQKQIVDGGFLELVRFGLMSSNDWTIRETLPEYDGLLRQSIPGRGDAWFRYNYDGYGERNDGSNYEKTGRGRLWPIFTAERGIYEALQQNNGSAGKAYKDALKAFSSPSGFIPEQVWNQTTKLLDWEIETPAPYVPGTPTKSIAPLNWAMGEYINLLHAMWKPSASRPEVVCQRYSCDKPMTTITFNVEAQTVWGEEIYLVGDNPLLGEWTPSSGIRMAAPSYPTWTVTTSLPANTPFSYKFLKRKDGQEIWEGGSNRSFSTPTSGEVTKAGTWQP